MSNLRQKVRLSIVCLLLLGALYLSARVVVALFMLKPELDTGITCVNVCDSGGTVEVRNALQERGVYDDANFLHVFVLVMVDVFCFFSCLVALVLARLSKAGRTVSRLVAGVVGLVLLLVLVQLGFGATIDFATQVTD